MLQPTILSLTSPLIPARAGGSPMATTSDFALAFAGLASGSAEPAGDAIPGTQLLPVETGIPTTTATTYTPISTDPATGTAPDTTVLPFAPVTDADPAAFPVAAPVATSLTQGAGTARLTAPVAADWPAAALIGTLPVPRVSLVDAGPDPAAGGSAGVVIVPRDAPPSDANAVPTDPPIVAQPVAPPSIAEAHARRDPAATGKDLPVAPEPRDAAPSRPQPARSLLSPPRLAVLATPMLPPALQPVATVHPAAPEAVEIADGPPVARAARSDRPHLADAAFILPNQPGVPSVDAEPRHDDGPEDRPAAMAEHPDSEAPAPAVMMIAPVMTVPAAPVLRAAAPAVTIDATPAVSRVDRPTIAIAPRPAAIDRSNPVSATGTPPLLTHMQTVTLPTATEVARIAMTVGKDATPAVPRASASPADETIAAPSAASVSPSPIVGVPDAAARTPIAVDTRSDSVRSRQPSTIPAVPGRQFDIAPATSAVAAAPSQLASGDSPPPAPSIPPLAHAFSSAETTRPAPASRGDVVTPSPVAAAQPATVADAAPAADPIPRDPAIETARPVARPGVTTVALPPAPPPAPEVRPAAQMFAQAMFAAAPIGADRDDRRGDSPAAALFPSVSVAAQGGFSAMAVPATVAAQSGTLDMARGEWMTSMIDRIETLRDKSGAIGETRLKLAPDALGAVDISVRRDEAGQYQVRIAADTAQARTLLAEAAPRLADMAEARGLKLSHAGVDSGTGANPGFTDSHRRDGQHAPAAPRRPVSAAANDTSAATGTNSDTRIA